MKLNLDRNHTLRHAPNLESENSTACHIGVSRNMAEVSARATGEKAYNYDAHA
jgi:hypothetical protein